MYIASIPLRTLQSPLPVHTMQCQIIVWYNPRVQPMPVKQQCPGCFILVVFVNSFQVILQSQPYMDKMNKMATSIRTRGSELFH